MIDPLSRLLRIRDDGTGKGRETNCNFAEFEREDAVILLGDPGMGKTTLFKSAAKGNYITVRNFIVNPHAISSEVLFIDALDESRAIESGQLTIDQVAKELCCLKKPKFRLSCRAADWFGLQDQDVIRVASASGRVVVLELRPLSCEEILAAVREKVSDPEVFVYEAEAAGLKKLLGNPQTLELIARAWGTNKKPRNKFEVFDIGIHEMLKEMNNWHVSRGANVPDLSDLRKAAGAVASTILLSNSVGISRMESEDDDTYVRSTIVPHRPRSSIDIVLKRRIFISPEADHFQPIHRTIAEFLAAEDLSNRILNGLPIDRVMALICGIDGRPVSSLRGLFAWLMCKLNDQATDYVNRDPYGVVTYADASELSPSAQCAVCYGLQELNDPWFLTYEDDHGFFRGLANPTTANIIIELIQGPATEIHLKIAMLEAITNSIVNIAVGANQIIRNMVLEKHDNTWLRTTALKAFSKLVQKDWESLEALDYELAHSNDDHAASKVRVDLLLMTLEFGDLPQRILSIMEQASSDRKALRVFGHFYPLISLPSDADLDEILDGASQVLGHKGMDHIEIRSLFNKWFVRRLENATPIDPAQLARWLQNLQGKLDRDPDKTIASLKARFQKKLSLFTEVFEIFVRAVKNENRSFWLFIAHDLWKLLPLTVWPVPQSEFFLTYAEKENNPEHAADLFRMYLSWFPHEGAYFSLAEAGFNFLKRRRDVAKVLGKWKSCKIEKWKKDQWNRDKKETNKHLMNKAKNITYLKPRLTTIRKGLEEHALAWAAMVYLGFDYQVDNNCDAHERLVNVTSSEIADAFIEGFIRYIENPNLPKKEAIIKSYYSGNITNNHMLLRLSIFLRINEGMTISEEVLPTGIVAVVTSTHIGDEVLPGYDDTLQEWFLTQVIENPNISRSILTEIWNCHTKSENTFLPKYYELFHNSDCQQFLALLSANVLQSSIIDDHNTVSKLVSVLLLYDHQTALTIGKIELTRKELSSEVRAIWGTVLFVVDPSNYLNLLRNLMYESNTVLWEVIEFLRGDRYEERRTVSLTPVQRLEVITLVGQRFSNIGHPTSSWSGSRNVWDASEFVANQVKLLSDDSSPNTDAYLYQLENDKGLESYRDFIRHHRALHQKQQRESSFIFASPEQVAESISNCAPATLNDLLSYIMDHLHSLSRGLRLTQRERYRAYWNENGLKIIKPKHEKVCSGLLAEDLQNKVQAHGLIVTVEHHMIDEKICDLVVLQGSERLLPIEVKHHYNDELWNAWSSQLDSLYTRDTNAGGLGIYLVFWSGEAKDRMMPKLPGGIKRPSNASELDEAIESLIPEKDKHRLRIVVFDISGP